MSAQDACDAMTLLKGEEWARERFPECFVPLMAENAQAMRIYLICQDQLLRAGMDGRAVAINHLAVHKGMELYKVRDPEDCFEKVLLLSGHFLEEERRQKEGTGKVVDDPMELLGVRGGFES